MCAVFRMKPFLIPNYSLHTASSPSQGGVTVSFRTLEALKIQTQESGQSLPLT